MTVTMRNGLLVLAFIPPCLSFRAFPRTSRRLFAGPRRPTNDVAQPRTRRDLLRACPTALALEAAMFPTPPPQPPLPTAAASTTTVRLAVVDRRRQRIGRRCSTATALRASTASEGEGEETTGGEEEGEEEPASIGDDDSGDESGGTPEGGAAAAAEVGGAEGMELRDFRARLMSKGLDGWGAEGGGEGAEESGRGGGGGGAKPGAGERWAHPLVRPELGCLVIAKDGMFTQQQQYFYKAVALVIQHGDDGTVALILNRPTTFTMGDMCTGNLQRVPGMEDNVLYMGGDVAGARDDGMDVVNLMHGREDVPAMEVVKGLRLGGLPEALALVAKGEAQPEEFKFFSRYSGWGPGQLEAEVLAGAWELAACDLESVLQNHNHPDQPGHFWAEIMSRLRQHSSNSR